MSADSFDELSRHTGHAVSVVEYVEQNGNALNVAIECQNCNEVLMDYDKKGN